MTTVLTFYVLTMDSMTLIAVAERHLSGSIWLCWFIAAKPSTYCKYCQYSLSVFAVYLCGEQTLLFPCHIESLAIFTL